MRDLKFLLEIQVFSSREIESMAKEVLFTLRQNRSKRFLPTDQVEIGNAFVLAAYRLASVDPAFDLEIPVDDITFLEEELQLLHMGSARN